MDNLIIDPNTKEHGYVDNKNHEKFFNKFKNNFERINGYDSKEKTIIIGNFTTDYYKINFLWRVDDFKKRFYSHFKPLKQYDLEANKMVIAGGICANFIISENIFSKTTDVDFFMIKNDIHPIVRIKKWIFDMQNLFKKSWNDKIHKCNFHIIGNNGTITMTITRVIIEKKYRIGAYVNRAKLQLITSEWDNIQSIFNSFDLDCCRVAFDGKSLIFDKSSILCYQTLTINVDFANYCPGLYEKRLIKYFYRGFKLVFNKEYKYFDSILPESQNVILQLLNLKLFVCGTTKKENNNIIVVCGIETVNKKQNNLDIDNYGCHVANKVIYNFVNLPKYEIDDFYKYNFTYFVDFKKNIKNYKNIEFKIKINFKDCQDIKIKIIEYFLGKLIELTKEEKYNECISEEEDEEDEQNEKDKKEKKYDWETYDIFSIPLNHLRFDNIFNIIFNRETVNPDKWFEIKSISPYPFYRINSFFRFTRNYKNINYQLPHEIKKLFYKNKSIENITNKYELALDEIFLSNDFVEIIKLTNLKNYCDQIKTKLINDSIFVDKINNIPQYILELLENRFLTDKYKLLFTFIKNNDEIKITIK